jgi:uncharacterized protein
MSDTHILYHAHCADGFCAALAAWLKFGDEAAYIPMNYDDPLPEVPERARVYLLDYSRPPEELQAWVINKHLALIVIDHHETAVRRIYDWEEALARGGTMEFPAFVKRLDITKSGCCLAWEFFHHNAPLPALFAYVQDRDLWKWDLPQSREVNTYLSTLTFDFAKWAWYAENDGRVAALVPLGGAILDAYDAQIRSMAERVDIAPIQFEMFGNDPEKWNPDGPTLQLALVNGTALRSDLAHHLLEAHPEVDVVGVYWFEADGTVRTSLRSRKGGVNVAQIAERFGGGGHPLAAGMSTPDRWWR